MNKTILQHVAAAGFAGVVAATSAASVVAAPVTSGSAMLNAAAPSHIVEVRWRRHWHGGGAGAGLAAGLIAGGIIGAAAANPYYYGPGYYYGPPPYAYPGSVYYAPSPAYVAPPADPNGAGRRCWVATDKDRGFGYWRAC